MLCHWNRSAEMAAVNVRSTKPARGGERRPLRALDPLWLQGEHVTKHAHSEEMGRTVHCFFDGRMWYGMNLLPRACGTGIMALIGLSPHNAGSRGQQNQGVCPGKGNERPLGAKNRRQSLAAGVPHRFVPAPRVFPYCRDQDRIGRNQWYA